MIENDNCPKCQSTNWICVDERLHRYEDMSQINDDMRFFDMSVGYLRCKDCGCQWQSVDLAVQQEHIIDITDEWYSYD